jgi:hypothetical protein
MSDKPPNHGVYQVWHEGKTLAVSVESTNVRDVERLTRKPPNQWKSHPAVTVHTENPRCTKLGDVIVDPTCGAWEVQADRYLAVTPPGPVAERMAREGIVPLHIRLLQSWTKDMLETTQAQDRTIAVEKPYEPADYARGRPEKGNEKDGLEP